MSSDVLILGAEGFIGRHLCFTLRAQGWRVTASARRTGALARMGFATLEADLTDPATHMPAFWRDALGGADLILAAGLLSGSEAAFRAVHLLAPDAALQALPMGRRAVLISAVGIDRADTAFARWRREAEAMAAGRATILRPGLVIADTSYGGSSLLRAMAACPVVTPLLGDGTQPFNPLHADDLAQVVAACLTAAPGPGPWDVGGAETVTQAQILAAYRGWLGLSPARALCLAPPVARALGRLGDALDLGPVSSTSVAQVGAGVLADPAPLLDRLPLRPRGLGAILRARPAGTQDLWQARLYLLKPLIRLTLALLWLVSGLLGLLLPAGSIHAALAATPLSDGAVLAAARAGGAVDLALSAALLRNWRPRETALAQIAVVLGYTLVLSLLAPALWLAPFGDLLKNLPILVLMLVHLALVQER